MSGCEVCEKCVNNGTERCYACERTGKGWLDWFDNGSSDNRNKIKCLEIYQGDETISIECGKGYDGHVVQGILCIGPDNYQIYSENKSIAHIIIHESNVTIEWM
jgi:hypothetical protein